MTGYRIPSMWEPNKVWQIVGPWFGASNNVVCSVKERVLWWYVAGGVIANLQYNNKLPRSVNFVFIPPSNFTLQNGDYFQIDRLTHVEVSCTPKSRPQRSSLLLIWQDFIMI